MHGVPNIQQGEEIGNGSQRLYKPVKKDITSGDLEKITNAVVKILLSLLVEAKEIRATRDIQPVDDMINILKEQNAK